MELNNSINLSVFRDDGSTFWFEEEKKRVGESRLRMMQSYLYKLADMLQVNDEIDIVRICRDKQNYRIAVKTCCEIVRTYEQGWHNRMERLHERQKKVTIVDEVQAIGKQFQFNPTCTRLTRIN